MTPPTLRSPIVLAHGLFGYDHLRLGGKVIRSYFRGLEPFLASGRNRVFTARVSPTAGVEERAAQLRGFIERVSPNEPVHIIGHSMGGLDARYMISRLGMAGRVLSLTTLGTPHRGSSFADWMMARFARIVLPFFRYFGLPCGAFDDLTTTGCRAFNSKVPDAANVRYFSVAADCTGDWLSWCWRVPYRIVQHFEGPNDGVVSVASARWGEDCEIWPGDHLNLVNCPNRPARAKGLWRDRFPEYARLLGRLRDAGF